jgi:phosphohistidine phosphatase
MRTLFLLRHAKSSWDDPALPDHERPLAPRGLRDAKRIAKHVGRLGITPELVLCSTAVRTQQTLDLLRPKVGEVTVQVEEQLYGASSETLLKRIRSVSDQVGPTAALVTLTLARWSNLSADNADLVAYVVPKQLH